MKITAIALTFLLATNVAAQIVDPNELSYGPFIAGPRDQSFAIGLAPHGMMLAWSEIDPATNQSVIHVGLLDFDAQLISPIRTLAPVNAGNHSTTPVVATDGERFFVAWLELDPSSWLPWRVSGALVDPTGVQLTGAVNFGRAVAGSPSLVWDGLTYRIYGYTNYTVTTDGVPAKTGSASVSQRVPFATPEANGWVDWTSGRREICFFRCNPTPQYDLQWAIVSSKGTRTGWFNDEGYTSGKPAVLAKEDDLLVIWSDTRGLMALPIVDGVAKRPFRSQHHLLRGVTEVAAAESLVVFEATGDIYGSVIVDGAKFGEPFPITSGQRWEELPRVYLIGPNRYLVTYAVDRDPAGIRLAGRFVSLTP